MPYLSMPVNINQNHDSVANTRSYGCAVCCAADVASFYGNTTYTLADMRAHGVYTNTDATCYWGNVPNTYFSSNLTYTSQSQYFSRIKREIDKNRPVIVHMNSGHYVVAYGYSNTGDTTEKIEVLDPYNSTGSGVYSDDPEGQDITLATSMRIQGASEIDFIKVTVAQ